MSDPDLICCPSCDAVYSVDQPPHGARAVCARCHNVLIVPRHKAGKQLIAIALAVVVLAVSAFIFPFLTVGIGGLENQASILSVVKSFSDVQLIFLSFAVAALIVVIPVTRVLLLLYVLIPIVRDRPPAPHARGAFRLSEELRPWAMAEIFALGCAVALVKVRDLADVGFGPAFWMFGALAALVVVQDSFLCRWSVWASLTPKNNPS